MVPPWHTGVASKDAKDALNSPYGDARVEALRVLSALADLKKKPLPQLQLSLVLNRYRTGASSHTNH